MSLQNIIRAWKDPEYRLNLNDAEQLPLPAHMAWLIELADAELDAAAGGVCADHHGAHHPNHPKLEPIPSLPSFDFDRYEGIGRGPTYQEVACSSTAGGGSEAMCDVDTCTEYD